MKLAVNGTVKEYDLALINSKKVQLTVGQVVQVDINNTTGKVQEVVADSSLTGTLIAGTVKVGAGTFNVGADNFTRAESGINVYEVVGTGNNKTVEVRTFSDLAQLKADNAVTYSMLGGSGEYVDTIVITKNEDRTAAASTPTSVNFTSSAAINATTAKEVEFEFTAEAGATVAYEITDTASGSIKGSVVSTGATNQKVTVDVSSLADGTITLTTTATNTKGTSAASVGVTANLDKTAPIATAGSTNTATSLEIDMDESSTVAITSSATLAGGETVSATGIAGITETFTIANAGAVDGDKFTFSVTDNAGNVSNFTATWDVANTVWVLN